MIKGNMIFTLFNSTVLISSQMKRKETETFQSLRLNNNLFVNFIIILIAAARLFTFDEVSRDYKAKSG